MKKMLSFTVLFGALLGLQVGIAQAIQTCSPLLTSCIDLVTPNGGESWNIGSTRTIIWNLSYTAGAVNDFTQTNIDLINETTGQTYYVYAGIYGGVSNGTYAWTIPASIPAGSSYKIRVALGGSAAADRSDGPFALVASDTAAPSTPTNLSTSALSSSQINLSWSPSTDNVGVTGYKVFRNGSQIITTPNTSFSDAGLSPSTTYAYTVAAYDAGGNTSPQSSPAQATTQAAPDTTAPVISNVSASSVTNGSAVISWVTNEPATSHVEYGLTTAYGSGIPMTTVLVTSHSLSLAGLSPSAIYHYRVKSKDAAGNLATSPDYIFSTLAAADTTAPTVSIVSPASGSTVSGSVNISASASDNVGVAGVQFIVDGVALGPEILASPAAFATTWNTLGYSNGSHAITARARDAAGNQTTSPAATVTVSNAPAPSTKFVVGDRVQTTASINVRATPSTAGTVLGSQLAGAQGTIIGGPTWADNYFWWQVNYDTGADGWSVEDFLVKVTAPTADTTPPSTPTGLSASAISSSQINLSWSASTDNVGVTGYKVYRNGSLLITIIGTSYSNIGLSPSTTYSYVVAAYDATGNTSGQSSSVSATTQAAADTSAPTVSISYPTSGLTLSGSITVSVNASDNVGVVGVQFKLDGANLGAEDTSAPYLVSWTTTSASNGPHTLTAVARDVAGNQTTSGGVTITVSNAVADTTPPSTPASLSALAISSSQINLSWSPSSDNVGVAGYKIYRNGVQIATAATNSYSNTGLPPSAIYSYTVAAYDAAGNVSGQSAAASATTQTAPDTTLPTISISSPPAGQTVSGSVTVSANASDNVGVAGVQFKVDGINLGAEVLAAPYSTSWNTAGSVNGSRTLTAVARDATGNQAISGGIAVTVNNITLDTIPPSTPSGLSASTVSPSQINLSWSPATDNVGVVGYKIFRNSAQIVTLAGTSYSDSGLSPATTYSYSVSAYDGGGNTSAQSASVSATTQSVSVIPSISASISPANPTTNDQVTISAVSNVTAAIYLYYDNVQVKDCVASVTCSQPLGALTAGTHSYRATAWIGNTQSVSDPAQLSRSFTVTQPQQSTELQQPIDTTAPTTVSDVPGYGYTSPTSGGSQQSYDLPGYGSTYSSQGASSQTSTDLPGYRSTPTQGAVGGSSSDIPGYGSGQAVLPGVSSGELTIGSQGSGVIALQSSLKNLGYFPSYISATGYFGPVTAKAVSDYQAAKGISVTGKLDTQTRTSLSSAAPQAAPTVPVAAVQGGTFTQTLGIGSRGPEVSSLQQVLSKDNEVYPEGLVTGYFGSLTQKAVQKFQLKYEIISSGTPETTGYGLVGPKTRAKLNELAK